MAKPKKQYRLPLLSRGSRVFLSGSNLACSVVCGKLKFGLVFVFVLDFALRLIISIPHLYRCYDLRRIISLIINNMAEKLDMFLGLYVRTTNIIDACAPL